MIVTTLPLAKIHPYAKNPRIIDRAIDAVASSISKFGWRQPIVVDKNYTIVCGHVRYHAAIKLGLCDVPVHVADNLTEKQIKAYRLADNKTNELAEWDSAALMSEIESIDDLVPGFDMDDFEKTISPPIQEIDPLPPPELSWVLIGIPTIRYGEIVSYVEAMAGMDGIIMETTVSSE